MPVNLSCPACSKKLHVKEEMAGKRIKCPACAKVFEVPAQPNTPQREVSNTALPRPEKRVLWPWVISGVSALLLVVVSAMWLMSGGNTRGRTGEQGADGELAMKAELAKVKAEAERTNSELVGTKADFAKVKADLESAKAEGESLKSDLGKATAEAEAATTKFAQAQVGRAEEKGNPGDLPGVKGSVFEYVGKKGPKVAGADVGAKIGDANSEKPPKARTLLSGTNNLFFDVKFKKKVPLTSVAIEVYDKAGKVEVDWSANVGFIEDIRTGAFYVSMSGKAKAAKLEDGAYQARLKLDGEVVARVNWEVGPPLGEKARA
jgi:hypothetical protein